jgi:uncharacterized protein YggT (Ycf19 family)
MSLMMQGILILVVFVIIIAFIVLLALVLMGWRNQKYTKGKMIAEIWEPSGFPIRNLIKIDEKTGKTVEIDGITYRFA